MRRNPLLLLAGALGCALLLIGCQGGRPSLQMEGLTARREEVTEPPKPEPTEIGFRAQGQRVPVIMYHDVIARRERWAMWYDCTVDEFEAQMQWLADQGAEPISVAQLYAHLTKGEPVPERAVVLTFDDNYQGFKDHALPILEKRGWPAAMFVHTGYVGDTRGKHPKMTWATLKELVKNPLITIGSHTITHPNDMSELSEDAQRKELVKSKEELEAKLGVPIDFLAYPNGKNDKTTQRLSREAGYKLAFTIDNGLAEASPNIMEVHRYVHTRLERAWEQRDQALRGGVLGIFEGEWKDGPVAYEENDWEGVRLALITGGSPVSIVSETREGVLEFVRRGGGVAGINGTFFAMAAIRSTDNKLIGPAKTADMPDVLPDANYGLWQRLRNRPMVLWSPKQLAIVPYQPELMNRREAYRDFMPDMTDCFLGGVWLVRDGIAREREDMNLFASKDIQDPRRRAFFGLMSDGRIVLGASKQSATSAQVARAAAAAGVKEAILLDSGFSTSIIYNEKVIASGHSTPEKPSRPVPHAIILRGSLDPESVERAESAIPAIGVPTDVPGPRKRRRRRRANPEVAPQSPPGLPAPSDPYAPRLPGSDGGGSGGPAQPPAEDPVQGGSTTGGSTTGGTGGGSTEAGGTTAGAWR